MSTMATREPVNRNMRPMWSPPIGGDTGQRVMDVGPDIARHMLTFNTHNRPRRQRHIESMAGDMAANRWLFNAEPVRFDNTGRLIDGQHRLEAVVLAERTVPMLVAWGLKPESQDVTDSGMQRSAGDAFALAGHTHVRMLAAIVRLLHAWNQETGLGHTTANRVTNAGAIDLLAANPDIEPCTARVVNDALLVTLAPASIIAFCYLICARVDPAAAEEFFVGLATGANLAVGDPRLALRRLLSNRNKSGSSTQRRWIVACVFKAWNMWRSGATTNVLTWNEAHKFPVPR